MSHGKYIQPKNENRTHSQSVGRCKHMLGYLHAIIFLVKVLKM